MAATKELEIGGDRPSFREFVQGDGRLTDQQKDLLARIYESWQEA